MCTLETNVHPAAVKPNRNQRILKWILGIAGGMILLYALFVSIMLIRMKYAPSGLDYSRRLTSDGGLYTVSYVSQLEPIRINQLHSWRLHIETPDGKPVEGAQITVDGDMPQHGHGLPTRPRVTRDLGNGDYQVDGLKFHMPGWWIVEFDIQVSGQTDHVTFNLKLDE
jgi:hypothetical protein